MDGVFNHTGREFFAFRDLQAHRDSLLTPDGTGTSISAGAARSAIPSATNPGTASGSFLLKPWKPEVRNYLLDTVRFWVQEFDIDGIRLDCAGDLPLIYAGTAPAGK